MLGNTLSEDLVLFPTKLITGKAIELPFEAVKLVDGGDEKANGVELYLRLGHSVLFVHSQGSLCQESVHEAVEATVSCSQCAFEVQAVGKVELLSGLELSDEIIRIFKHLVE